jgi:hypothetical protein
MSLLFCETFLGSQNPSEPTSLAWLALAASIKSGMFAQKQ